MNFECVQYSPDTRGACRRICIHSKRLTISCFSSLTTSQPRHTHRHLERPPVLSTWQFTEIAGAVYPDEYEAFLAYMAFVNVDVSLILSRACIITPDFYDRLIVATTGPLVVLLGCAGTFFAAKRKNRNFSVVNHILKKNYLSVVIFIVFFVYSSVSFTILQTFVCDSLDDGKAYLRADYSITCYTDTYTAYQTYASFMVFVYPIGIPAFFAWMLVRNRRELEKPERETVSDLQSFRSLWVAYRPSCYYYEIVECGRRIVLTGAAVFVISDSAEQIAFVLLLAVVFMFISESISPFESRLDMWLYRWGNGIILASMYVALLLKVDLAVEGSHGSGTITALLIAANVFMLVTVAVQSVLLIRGLCISSVQDKLNRAPSTFPANTWLERSAALEGIDSELDVTQMQTRSERNSAAGLINSRDEFFSA